MTIEPCAPAVETLAGGAGGLEEHQAGVDAAGGGEEGLHPEGHVGQIVSAWAVSMDDPLRVCVEKGKLFARKFKTKAQRDAAKARLIAETLKEWVATRRWTLTAPGVLATSLSRAKLALANSSWAL